MEIGLHSFDWHDDIRSLSVISARTLVSSRSTADGGHDSSSIRTRMVRLACV